MRRHTIVLPGGNVAGDFARAAAFEAGLTEPRYFMRRDGRVQATAYAREDDKGARSRWVRTCAGLGLTVDAAPWEKPKGAVAKVEAALTKVAS